MKNYKSSEQNYVVKLSGFLFLLFIVLACNMSQNSDKSETDSKKPETTKKTKTGGIEKLKTQSKPKEVEKNAMSSSDDWREKVCKKYDECGCQDYEECMEGIADLNYEEKTWSCLLKSSCEGLCANQPDGCAQTENNPTTTAPDVPNCSGTTCTKNSDCPGGCHGGCSEGRCYLF